MGLTRRQFLKWAGATGIGAVVFNGCNVPDEEIQVQSPLRMPEDLVTGRDNYYATVSSPTEAAKASWCASWRAGPRRSKATPTTPEHG